MDRGLAYAESCFETFRVIHGEIFCWSAHMERLQSGLDEFGILLAAKEIEGLHTACLSAAVRHGSDVLVRLSVSGGEAKWGLFADRWVPRAYVQAKAYQPVPDLVHLVLKQWPFPPKMRLAKFTADYSDTLRALKGCADSNILFAHNGYLLGAATANVLIYRQNHWYTPVIGPGVLPGIVRAYLLETGLLKETDCSTSYLEDCEAVTLTNCGFFLRQVIAVSRADAGELNYDIIHPAFEDLVDALTNKPGVII